MNCRRNKATRRINKSESILYENRFVTKCLRLEKPRSLLSEQ